MRRALALVSLVACIGVPTASGWTPGRTFLTNYCTAWAKAYNSDHRLQAATPGHIRTPTSGVYHGRVGIRLERIVCHASTTPRISAGAECLEVTLQGPATENGHAYPPSLMARVPCVVGESPPAAARA